MSEAILAEGAEGAHPTDSTSEDEGEGVETDADEDADGQDEDDEPTGTVNFSIYYLLLHIPEARITLALEAIYVVRLMAFEGCHVILKNPSRVRD